MKPVLIFVNPKSGTGHAKVMFQKALRPALEAQEVKYEVIFTEFQGHALDVIKHVDLNKYLAFITVSGDGIIHEVINGFYARPDWKSLDTLPPLGLVPGGTGCALNCSMLGELGQPLDGLNSLGPSASVQNVVDGVVEGRSKPLDLIEVELMDGTKQMSLLGVTIGVVADGDIGSEWLRCMGFLRAYLHVAWRFIFPAPYLAKVSYLPLEIDKTTGKPIPITPDTAPLQLPALHEPVPQDWITDEDRYHVVYALNLSHLDPMTIFAPGGKIGDGIMWMVFVRGSISRMELFKWFMALSEGPDIKSKHLDCIPIRAFRIEPIDPQEGILSLDAESAPFGPCQGQLVPQKGRVLYSVNKDL